MPIDIMGHFTAIGMRTPVAVENALVINTCSDNDTAERGSLERWSWSNPTNRKFQAQFKGITAVSTEAMWQGTKLLPGQTHPDADILNGQWRKNKGKRPAGAWNGEGEPLITTPGGARRAIYVPTFRNQVERWLQDPMVAGWIEAARNHDKPVFLRDFDTGRGIDRNGPMSHGWVLAVWLNSGRWPDQAE